MFSKNTGRVAFCGVMGALALGILFLTVIPVTEIALPALAGVVGIPVIIEAGKRGGLTMVAAVGLLALLLVPNVESKGLYIAFFGYYPVFKAWLEGKKLRRFPEWLIKLALFNAATVAAYAILLRFFHLDPEMFTVAGVSLPWMMLLLGNGVFVLYDIGLTRLITAYCYRWRAKVKKLFHL